ncbi:DUF1351 domain-containing protein [Lactococcus formosensis]|uniref:DUF1351 domain-containing protein n=1 Tax=Lactococcus formosensis TaxID=1281486 RepID=UPI00254AE31D|nr:DUF1351 domain-containing protein [Lactococcus formosensis]
MSEALEIQEIQVDFEPAIINIADREEFEATINNYVEKFQGYVVTPETLKDDKKLLAAFRKALKSIDEKRKEVKKEFNKPLEEFEKWIKDASSSLDKLIDDVDTQVKQYEAEQKRKRKEAIYIELKEQSEKQNIDYRLFENFMNDWNKAANFNDQLEPKKVLKDSIKFVVEQERLKRDENEKNKGTISNFALMSDISDTPYIRMYEEGKDLSDILEIMNEDIANEKARKEAQRLKAEQEAEDKRKAEEQKLQELANQQLEKDFNIADTEQVQKAPIETQRTKPVHDEVEEAPKEQDVYYATIEFRFDSVEQKDAWKAAMNKIGLTQVVGKDTELTVGNQYKATSYRKVKI